ncbi:hypothetical protein AALO_G00133060 [Alosa alosa]|uniref:Uncharacterized protein n=1 Tax=Alosa alosa TaxID=278164 RepID=A0AAV6GL10_9TELE|nr:hypothetical protein AALO_G00133060 [Alosa alosa]
MRSLLVEKPLESCFLFLSGWYRGFTTKKPTVKGIFPTNYVYLKRAVVTNRGQYETVVPLEDPVVAEVTSTLQDWAVLWKQLYVQKHKVDLFYKLCHVMNELIDLRRQLISGHLTQDQTCDVKRHITVRLDWGNEHLGLDLVPRKEFEMVDADQISVSDLYKMHLSSRHSVQQSTTQGDSLGHRHGEAFRIPVPHHLFMNLKSFTYNTIGEDTDILFSLYDLREGKHISEKFMVRLSKNGGPKNPEKMDRLCALFTDLSNKDMKRDLYIISQFIRTGRMLLNDSKKGPPHVQYRRPYGCAVLAMSDVLQTISEMKEEKDFVLKVYTYVPTHGRTRGGAWWRTVQWCKLNHLQLNTAKTREMVVDFRRSKPALLPVSIDGVNVEVVNTYKYLGLQLDNKLDWSANTEALYKKGQSRLHFLRRLRSFNVCSNLLRMFYQRPLLCCCMLGRKHKEEGCWATR